MSNDIPEWITNLALDIYRPIQKYDALASFQEKVREWAIGHEAEVNRHLEWRKQRNLHFEETVNSDPRLQDEKSGPPDEGWEWEIQPLNISPQIDPDTKLPIKIVKAWVPPELSGDSKSDIKHILPLSREQQLSLTEKYTLLAAIYDFGRKGTDQIPPWDWTDLNTDVSPDEFADVKKCLSFEVLCEAASRVRQEDEGWLRAFLDDVKNDLRKNIKRHKPWYKKIWVLILGVAVLLAAIVSAIQICESETGKNIINSLKRKPSISEDYRRTKLYVRTKKRVDDFYESIRDKKLDPWLFINAKGVEVKVVKHNGDVIKYNAVLFTGAPRTVFWSDDFIPLFIEDAIIKVFEQTIDECRKNGLDPEIYVYEAKRILSDFIYKIYNRMADMDQKLMKQLYSENFGHRDVSGEIEKMCKCLDEHYNAAILLASGKPPNLRLPSK